MLIRTFTCAILFFITGCFYAKTRITAADREYIPYRKSTQLIFLNTANVPDTVFLQKELVRTSNFEFFLDRKFGRTNDSRKPYYESYSSDVSLKRTIAKQAAHLPYLKYHPMIFSFCKEEDDTVIKLLYFIDGRWNGTITFDSIRMDTLRLKDRTFTDVVAIKNDSLDLFEIDKMYWSVKYGLLRIDEKNGEQWKVIK